MKLVTLTAAAALLYTMPAFAQTCASAPSCADLGYTKSASQCTGDKLACPFDKTKFYCVQQPKIVNPAIGDLKYSVNGTPGTGWLRCDGKEYSQTTYADLYKVIGTNFCHKYTSRKDAVYTTNNCSSGKFAVPDYRGFFLRGLFSSATASNVPGANNNNYSTALQYKGGTEGETNVYIPTHQRLPNLTGEFTFSQDILLYLESSDYTAAPSGVFSKRTISSVVRKGRDQSSKTDNRSRTILFNASNSNAIYDGTSTVLPAHYNAYIYIYAGK